MKFRQTKGEVPVLVSFPHSGTNIPATMAQQMTNHALTMPDTDWDLPRLYDFVDDLGVATVAANFSRYVIDPNRSTDGANLYPGRPTPELCPTLCFDGSSVYRDGMEPDQFEVARRTAEYWQGYHDAIQAELCSIRNRFGHAVLFDAHSINSEVPRLFEGRLPDFNIGTSRGTSCAATMSKSIETVLKSQQRYSWVFNGRFVGGYITRHYGAPRQNIHAVQLELSKATYMDESRDQWDDEKANMVRPRVRQILESVVNWAANLK